MIIDKNKINYQTRSDKPDSFWLNESERDNYFVIHDNSILAQKIRANYPDIEYVLDENENLIDVNIKTADKEKRQKKEEYNKQIAQLKMQLRNTDYQALKFAEGQITAADYEAIKHSVISVIITRLGVKFNPLIIFFSEMPSPV